MFISQGTRRVGRVLLLSFFVIGCDNGVAPLTSPRGPASPSPAPPPAPLPAPTNTSSLFGVVTQMTATGSAPVEGVRIEEMTCEAASVGCGQHFVQSATTGKDGLYRITGLYEGRNNFVWIMKEGYDPVGMPPVPSCDYCNHIVTVSGETRLDIELARR